MGGSYKTNIKEIGWEVVDWIYLALDTEKLLALENRVTKLLQ
jgi:hypothetical protein